MDIEEFVAFLASQNTPDKMSQNMYKGETKGAVDRCENLTYYMEFMKKLKPARLLVGEAPGRYGCYITGVPFTDQYTLVHNGIFGSRFGLINELMEVDKDIKPRIEPTASVVWGCLSRMDISQYPLMWNIYPYHPSKVEAQYFSIDDRINRKPNRAECELGKKILELLMGCFDIKEVYAVGRIPERVLKNDFPNIKYIRHPSRGGANEFRKGFNEIFKR